MSLQAVFCPTAFLACVLVHRFSSPLARGALVYVALMIPSLLAGRPLDSLLSSI